MTNLFPELVWSSPDEFHRQLIAALDESFSMIAQSLDLERGWRSFPYDRSTETSWREVPMLGRGPTGRDAGGFWRFAEKYAAEERQRGVLVSEALDDRCSFEQYCDFIFYNGCGWEAGAKRAMMIAEVEVNPAKLRGELSRLVSYWCPIKYLFIVPQGDMPVRLSRFCADPASGAVDFAGTTYFIIEIPTGPSLPSTWSGYKADVQNNGDALRFRPLDVA